MYSPITPNCDKLCYREQTDGDILLERIILSIKKFFLKPIETIDNISNFAVKYSMEIIDKTNDLKPIMENFIKSISKLDEYLCKLKLREKVSYVIDIVEIFHILHIKLNTFCEIIQLNAPIIEYKKFEMSSKLIKCFYYIFLSKIILKDIKDPKEEHNINSMASLRECKIKLRDNLNIADEIESLKKLIDNFDNAKYEIFLNNCVNEFYVFAEKENDNDTFYNQFYYLVNLFINKESMAYCTHLRSNQSLNIFALVICKEIIKSGEYEKALRKLNQIEQFTSHNENDADSWYIDFLILQLFCYVGMKDYKNANIKMQVIPEYFFELPELNLLKREIDDNNI